MDKDDIEQHKSVQQDAVKQTDLLTAELENRVQLCVQANIEMRQQLLSLNQELTDKNDVIQLFEQEEVKLKEEIDKLQRDLKEACRNRDRFKEDAKGSHEIIAECEKLIDTYEGMLDKLGESLLDLVDVSSPAPVEDLCSNDESENSPKIKVKAVFICCGDNQYHNDNIRAFDKLCKTFSRDIDFGSAPVFVPNSKADRPPVPENVNLVVMLMRGLSHTDGHALRNVIRSNMDVHICSQIKGTSLIITELRKWLENPDFAQASVPAGDAH